MDSTAGVYVIVKDFAQPTATLLAALAVGFFAYRQWRTAQQQANVALDQLRYNLFQKRYAIYNDVKTLLQDVLNNSNKPECSYIEVLPHYVVIDEAIFFFSPPLCKWLNEVRDDCQAFFFCACSMQRTTAGAWGHTASNC